VKATDVRFISRILGQAELPVQNIILKNVKANTIAEKGYIQENVVKFKTE
jgi:hypothetical protein